jgi:hypothetical protein
MLTIYYPGQVTTEADLMDQANMVDFGALVYRLCWLWLLAGCHKIEQQPAALMLAARA